MVFYGSQTGTGEEFAGRLAKEGLRYRLKGMVADPEECDMVTILFIAEYVILFSKILQEELVNLKTIPNSLAVFCLATYGEGDPTDNAMEFFEWLQNGDADLTGLNYAVRINRFIYNKLHIIIIIKKFNLKKSQTPCNFAFNESCF